MFILTIVPIPLAGDIGSVNPSDRLAEIRGKIAVAEQRVRDLEGLLTALILGNDAVPDNPADPTTLGVQWDADPNTAGVQHVSGLITALHPNGDQDANLVRQELYRARAFEGELRTAENFWNEIVSSNKAAEQKTHELFKAAGG